MKSKQDIDYSKTKFIAYDYLPGSHLTINECNEITEGNFWGSVSYSKKRMSYRDLNFCYSKGMEKSVCKDYERLLKKLDLVPRPKLLEIFKPYLNKIFKISEDGINADISNP